MSGRTESRRDRSRLDLAMVERGIVESRAKAQAMILANDVLVNGNTVSRAGAPVRPSDSITVRAPARFVSRGGEKLEHAIETFAIDVHGAVAADFGASTGGFTDCLLHHGAARVYAVDVGYGQLAERLRVDPRVVVLDRVNARNLEPLPEPIDIVTVDVSFIGLRLVLPAAIRVLGPDGVIVALIKPQFEAGKSDVGRGGVVRDPRVHRRVLDEVVASAGDLGLGVAGLTPSPLKGPAGNVEFLVYLRQGEAPEVIEPCINDALAIAERM